MTAKESKAVAFYVQPHLVGICKQIGHVQKEHRVIVATEKTGSHTVPLYEESALHAAESLLAEAEMDLADSRIAHQSAVVQAMKNGASVIDLQSRLDAVAGLADDLETCVVDYSDDMSSGAFSRLNDFPDQLRSAALGGESPGNDEELK